MSREELIGEIKRRLVELYGDRLKGIILYGSEARKTSRADSDVDILVLLAGPVNFGRELRSIVYSLYDLQLEAIRPLELLPVDAAIYESQQWPLYRFAATEGIVL
jgi:uncharacterized protein